MHKKLGRNLTSCFSATAKSIADVIGNQSGEDFLEMFMDNGPASGSHPRRACLPVPVNVVKHRKAEPGYAFVLLP